MTRTLTIFALLGLIQQQNPWTSSQYSPPPSLNRDNGVLTNSKLLVAATAKITYSWHDESGAIGFRLRTRPAASDHWGPQVTQEESVSFYMTAVSPVYGPEPVLYVFGIQGTQQNHHTIIERWTIDTSADGVSLDIDRSSVATSTSLNHLIGAAVAPDESFALVQMLESRDVWKVDFPSMTITPVANPGTYANLLKYDFLSWARHTQSGGVFKLQQARTDVRDIAEVMLLWDSDEDGQFELIEELQPSEMDSRGYFSPETWYPDIEFDSFGG
jgi:hypothetical protein